MDNNFDNTPKDDSTPVSLSKETGAEGKDMESGNTQTDASQQYTDPNANQTGMVSSHMEISRTAITIIIISRAMDMVMVSMTSRTADIATANRVRRVTGIIIISRIITITRTIIAIIPGITGIITHTDRDRILPRCLWETGFLRYWRL